MLKMEPKLTEEAFITSIPLLLQNPKMKVVLIEDESDWGVFTKIIPKQHVYFLNNQDKSKINKKTQEHVRKRHLKHDNDDNHIEFKLEKKIFEEKRNKIIEIVRIINMQYEDKAKRVLCILNKSNQNLLGKNLTEFPDNIIFTDYHDLLVQVFTSKAMENFISNTFEKPWEINIEKICEECLQIVFEYDLLFLIGHDLGLNPEKINLIKNSILKIEKFINIDFYFDDDYLLVEFAKLIKIYNDNLQLEANSSLKSLIKKIFKDRVRNLTNEEKKDVITGVNIIRVLSLMILTNYSNLCNNSLHYEDKSSILEDDQKFDKFLISLTQDIKNAYDYGCILESKLIEKIIDREEECNINFLKENPLLDNKKLQNNLNNINKKLKNLVSTTDLIKTDTRNIKKDTDTIKKDTNEMLLSLKLIMQNFKSLKNIKLKPSSNEDDLSKKIDDLKEELAKFESNLKANLSPSQNIIYIDLLKNEIEGWDILENLTKDKLILGLNLYDLLNKINEDDFSPVILQYSVSFENEILIKIFRKFTKQLEDLLKNEPEIFGNLISAEKKYKNKKPNKIFKFASTLNRLQKNNLSSIDIAFPLGDMHFILKLLLDENLVKSSELMKKFNVFILGIGEKIISKSFINQIYQIKKDYRNRSAHPDKLNEELAIQCKIKVLETINDFIERLNTKYA